MFVDSHCHLDQVQGLEALALRAQEAGVARMVSCATSLASMEAHLARFKAPGPVLPALGLHPADLVALDDGEAGRSLAFLEAHLPEAVAVGEVGLDYKYAVSTAQRGRQKEFFSRFIALAKARDKPLNVHSRRAERPVLEQLIAEGAQRVLLHWFTGSSKLCKLAAAQQGYFVSCGPTLLTNELTQGVVKGIPLENLLLETDAPVPYSLPDAAAPEASEPAWIPRVAANVAELHGLSLKEVERQTWKNAKSLWGFR
ncbi:MAG TPA: TatD family hydrolase [Candidatus Diapherotrites archaeon]|uniref:TatD family hydrolase n=1 Tax=Candidatus Iainarchaeum sp. TaxID=3101447 RepID=A0A7J4JE40_9ARCH|nr:TatD family hydrolase [Candidatus Diapherotrites archaeon]